MTKLKKLCICRQSKKSFSFNSEELPIEVEKNLSVASQIANENISHNNQVYFNSNVHSHYYTTK